MIPPGGFEPVQSPVTPDSPTEAFILDGLEDLAETFFLKLSLQDPDGEVVSDNFNARLLKDFCFPAGMWYLSGHPGWSENRSVRNGT